VPNGVDFVEAQTLGVETLLARKNGNSTLEVFEVLCAIAIMTSIRISAFYTY
jgi:hypothetical protein